MPCRTPDSRDNRFQEDERMDTDGVGLVLKRQRLHFNLELPCFDARQPKVEFHQATKLHNYNFNRPRLTQGMKVPLGKSAQDAIFKANQ